MKAGEEENDRGGKKRVKIDCFGELPDSLLIHILSFLTMKEAAITSVLSKRWEFLWADLPNLEFNKPKNNKVEEIEKVSKFVSWINRPLAIRTKGIYLEKFYVLLRTPKNISCDIDAWIQFAKENKVKELTLYIVRLGHFYRPHQAVYSCSSLTRLALLRCIMENSGTRIEWRSLTHLHLWSVRVGQHLLDQILSSCPVLHEVILRRCRGFNRLEANSRRLYSVTVEESKHEDVDDNNEDDAPPLEISVPFLHTLNGCVRTRKWKLVNIKSLVRVIIDCHEFSWDSISVEEVMSGARDLLESVQNVKELHLGPEFIKLVSLMAVNGWQLPQSRRDLLIVVSKYEHIISGIIGLLESSPKLENFFLYIEGCATREGDEILDQIAKDDLVCDLLHLKLTCIVSKLGDLKDESMILTLAKILLKRAPILERSSIECNFKDKSYLAKMAQKIGTYPKTSTKAAVHLIIGKMYYNIYSP